MNPPRSITTDWPATNARRGELMDREDADTLTPAEERELAELQRLADLRVEHFMPRYADSIIADLKRRGLWRGEEQT